MLLKKRLRKQTRRDRLNQHALINIPMQIAISQPSLLPPTYILNANLNQNCRLQPNIQYMYIDTCTLGHKHIGLIVAVMILDHYINII